MEDTNEFSEFWSSNMRVFSRVSLTFLIIPSLHDFKKAFKFLPSFKMSERYKSIPEKETPIFFGKRTSLFLILIQVELISRSPLGVLIDMRSSFSGMSAYISSAFGSSIEGRCFARPLLPDGGMGAASGEKRDVDTAAVVSSFSTSLSSSDSLELMLKSDKSTSPALFFDRRPFALSKIRGKRRVKSSVSTLQSIFLHLSLRQSISMISRALSREYRRSWSSCPSTQYPGRNRSIPSGICSWQ